jgi:hypothetical protein
MKKILLINFLFLSVNLFGQSTFKILTETKTGAITAYSSGIEFKNLFQLQPRYNSKKYYLKLSSNEITIMGGLEYIWKYCFFNNKGNVCSIILYIKIDEERVLKLIGKGNIKNSEGISSFSFPITAKDIKAISISKKLSMTLETSDLDDYENFPYNFKYEELFGFRDFCEGMKI